MNKNGQEEIVGFILIVIIVAVVFLVLLGIFIRSDSVEVERKSAEVSQFLDSAMEYTTDCAIGFEPNYLTLGALIRECYEGGICTSGDLGCDVLDETMREVLDSNWNVGISTAIKGYRFNATWSNGGRNEEVIFVKKGECSFNVRGADSSISLQDGYITYFLNLCY